jgi:arylsulfatase A-like enzyme
VWCLSSTIAQLREVLDTLHATGALANAVVAVASDNGGCPADGASNWPLRGTKFSSFEVHTYTRNDPVPLRLGLPL